MYVQHFLCHNSQIHDFLKLPKVRMGIHIVWVYFIYKKTTRRFKHCEEVWRVLVLRRYVKIMIQQTILLIFIF